MLKIYYEKDADISVLKGKKIAVIGYGSQGHAQAQNLRESGMDVIVSTRTGTPNYQLAVKHGFKPVTVDEAARQGDFLQILMPDETQKSVYESQIKPHLKDGKTLCFSHGFNIHFGQVMPPNNVDVIMVAPKDPDTLSVANLKREALYRVLWPFTRMPREQPRKRRLPMRMELAAHGLE